MPGKRFDRGSARPLCGEVGPGDGEDPKERERTSSRSPARSGPRGAGGRKGRGGPKGASPSWVRAPGGAAPEPGYDRKDLQVARQAARTLEEVFAGDSRDEVLGELRVLSVVPAPDASHLLVTVGPALPLAPSAVLARLAAASGRLRAEVAAAVNRKRAPSLTYRVGPAVG